MRRRKEEEEGRKHWREVEEKRANRECAKRGRKLCAFMNGAALGDRNRNTTVADC